MLAAMGVAEEEAVKEYCALNIVKRHGAAKPMATRLRENNLDASRRAKNFSPHFSTFTPSTSSRHLYPTMTFTSWADSLPAPQGLYNPELEKDACGVGFIVSINGTPSHQITFRARNILCNMAHRGAVGANEHDGDGAGVMTAIPDQMFRHNTIMDLTPPLFAANGSKVSSFSNGHGTRHLMELPPPGRYAAGNIFMNPQDVARTACMQSFESLARNLGLSVFAWRRVPCNSDILGPTARSKEPVIMQPFVSMDSMDDDNRQDGCTCDF
jgi:glutamate synthase domain-containing protein 1